MEDKATSGKASMRRSSRRGAVAAALVSALLVAAVALPMAQGPGLPPDGPAKAAVLQAGDEAVREGADAPQPSPGAASEAEGPSSLRPAESLPADDSYEPGVLILGLADGASPADAVAAVRSAFPPAPAEGSFSVEAVTDSYVKVAVPGNVALEDAIAALSASDAIASAQPNFLYYPADDGLPKAALLLSQGVVQGLGPFGRLVPNDPLVGDQWALESIDAYGAWDSVRSGRYVTVAVVDNMFDLSHEDLRGNVVAPYNAVAQLPGYDMGAAAYRGGNVVGHGTHVAGVVAAEAGNAVGVAGVSYNACIMPVRVEDDGGAITTEYLVNAYDYVIQHAAEHNVRVVNLSIGAGRPDLSWESLDLQLFSKIDEAYDRGIVTVTAACNAGHGYTAPFYCFPGDYDACVNVINVTRDLERASSSNYNRPGQRSKDISAPGTGILSTTMTSNADPADDSYGVLSGTSMAAPCVSGVLALMFAADPALTADQAVSKLYSTATDLNVSENADFGAFDLQTGWGEVNAASAVRASAVLLEGETTMAVGGQAVLSLKPAQADAWEWSSDDPSVASVTGDAERGVVTGLRAGVATITATDGRESRAVQTVTVYDPAITGDTFCMVGQTARLSVAASPVGVWNWASSDPSVASVQSVSGSGCTVSCRQAGTVRITATLATNPAVTSSVELRSAMNLTGAELRNVTDLVLGDGPAVQPDMQVVLRGAVLVPGVDYETYYEDNDALGTATLTVVGRGSYVGSKSRSFRIGAGTVALADVRGVADAVYTGSPVTMPDLEVALDGAVLTPGADYALTYLSNVNAGTASLVIAGLGDYVGELRVPFQITPASLDGAEVSAASHRVYTGQPIRTTVSVQLAGRFLSSPRDFLVRYEDNVDAGTARIVVTGTGNYQGEATGSFEIHPAPIGEASVRLPAGPYRYAGVAVRPEPAVWAGRTVLVRGRDYELSWTGGGSPGTATVSVRGMGNYAGSVSESYEVASTPISAVEVRGVSMQYRTGQPVTPRPQVYCDGHVLRANIDYAVSYQDNVDVGTATIRLVGLGGFTGEWVGSFDIVDRPVYSSGASRMPVGSTSSWALQKCRLEVVEGRDVVAVAGGEVVALGPGAATIAVVGARGTVATRQVEVYPLEEGAGFAGQPWRITVDSLNRVTFVAPAMGAE